MRWDALRLDTDGVNAEPADEAGQNALPLPLAGQGARVRTFDTPEFRGMTFYEVRAKSVLNRVPGASQVPFEWTVNPYRGCSHACVYCLTGDTEILLADGSTRRLADVRPGDRIYGTEVRDGRRRYVVTEVLAHWRTVKPAYRVLLEDGTELVASGDHRFLTRRGWKHVTGAALRRGVRPHLTRNDELVGFGRSSPGLTHLLGGSDPSHRNRRRASHLGVATRAFRPAGATALRRGDHPSHHGDPAEAAPASRSFGERPEAGPPPLRPRPRRVPTVEDIALKVGARLRVTAIEPLGLLMPMYDITTGTGDFVANGVVSHNCFARRTHTYLDLDAGADFDSRVVVKVNTAEALRHDLAAPTWRRAHVAMGTNVDCYQRAEGRYQLMPGVISALRDFRTPFSILTKGTLLLRDLPQLVEAATEVSVSLNVSIGSVDRTLWRSVEPGTPAPQARLRMVRAIRDAGLDCGVLIGPVIPYLSDSPRQLDETVAAIAEAGATRVSAIPLHLRPGAREWFMEWLQRHHPTLVPAYHRLFRGGSYAPAAYRRQIGEVVRSLASKHGIGDPGADRGRWMGEPTEPTPEPPTQLTLI